MSRHDTPLNPHDIPASFWAVVEQAQRDRSKMRVILQAMTREEMVAFHQQFFDAAMAVASHEHVQHMAPGTSEDGADDVSRWVVAHPEKSPAEVAPHSREQIYYEISSVFIQRFGESMGSEEDD